MPGSLLWIGRNGRASGGRRRVAVALFGAVLTACSFEYSDADASPTLYSEYDRNGILVTAGNATRAVYYTERKDAEAAGAIRLRSQSQGV